MTGPEHYRRAEDLIDYSDKLHDRAEDLIPTLMQAQVHATLALAAATALSAHVDYGDDTGGLHPWDADQWRHAAARKREDVTS